MSEYARIETTWILVIGGLATLGLALLGGPWFLLVMALTLALLAFYRDPHREVTRNPQALLSPADGRIMSIEPDYVDAEGRTQLRICIFLSVLNVHVNRSPCPARVVRITYEPGKFLNALGTKATDENENNLLELESRGPLPGPIFVRQIAGALARRIVCAVEPEDRLESGQRFGMIKLGSQTELRAPAHPDWQVRVSVGMHVQAGVTVLAELESEPESHA